MEALWSRFLPSYEFIMDQLKQGVIGDVLHVTANLGFNNADVARIATKELGGGTVLDLGVYTINIVEQAFNGETPEKVLAVGHLNKNGVDYDFAASLQFKDQKTASISCHSLLNLENEATIVGTKGIIKV
jgi:dihydrodiol dehydrogenase / D-xylose 1-dehydrogenase (NADP)